MKDLNLRDEAARYQQAPQPDMVSTQVRLCQGAAVCPCALKQDAQCVQGAGQQQCARWGTAMCRSVCCVLGGIDHSHARTCPEDRVSAAAWQRCDC